MTDTSTEVTTMLNITDLSQAELQAAVKVGSGIQGADTDLAKAYAGHLLT